MVRRGGRCAVSFQRVKAILSFLRLKNRVLAIPSPRANGSFELLRGGEWVCEIGFEPLDERETDKQRKLRQRRRDLRRATLWMLEKSGQPLREDSRRESEPRQKGFKPGHYYFRLDRRDSGAPVFTFATIHNPGNKSRGGFLRSFIRHLLKINPRFRIVIENVVNESLLEHLCDSPAWRPRWEDGTSFVFVGPRPGPLSVRGR